MGVESVEITDKRVACKYRAVQVMDQNRETVCLVTLSTPVASKGQEEAEQKEQAEAQLEKFPSYRHPEHEIWTPSTGGQAVELVFTVGPRGSLFRRTISVNATRSEDGSQGACDVRSRFEKCSVIVELDLKRRESLRHGNVINIPFLIHGSFEV